MSLPPDAIPATSAQLPPLPAHLIYKLVAASEWRVAESVQRYTGSVDDRRDGYIHLSTAAQVETTLAKYFSAVDDLLLVAVNPLLIAADLRYEPSRGGAQFPHLYADLPVAACQVLAHRALADAPWRLADA
ncbi:MAG: DUF952 domain-containing protein [Lysobacterales bacterium]